MMGKGSKRRSARVSDEQVERNWNMIFRNDEPEEYDWDDDCVDDWLEGSAATALFLAILTAVGVACVILAIIIGE